MRRIVISYAREDVGVVQELAQTLTAFGHQPWIDAGARHGASWWSEILEQLRGCEVLLVVVSPAGIASTACAAERRYAMQLGKPVLPVMTATTPPGSMPSDLAQINILDYTHRDAAASGRLFQALTQQRRPGPLPNSLPPAPQAPLSYLNGIRDQLQRLPVDLDRQHEIVTALSRGLSSSDPEERAIATELMQAFVQHPQRLHDPTQRAQTALAHTGRPTFQQFAAPAPTANPAPPAGPAPTAGPAPKRSKVVTILAWIGAIFVLLIIVANLSRSGSSGSSNPSEAPRTPQQAVGSIPAVTLQEAVITDLTRQIPQLAESDGVVTCPTVQARDGEVTTCLLTLGDNSFNLTVRIVVQGGTLTGATVTVDE